ncbi:carboxymuconolactone decarboxylase family protein [Saccharomonospora sp. NPDC046836]|uniref:carboxymuconolactone decarboxylase family protein n=1 Tax=Saccharomonospora sp. NPDC046836 TaxID=3156921 RepID=UPI0033D58DB2
MRTRWPKNSNNLAVSRFGHLLNSRRVLLNHPELLDLFAATPQWFKSRSRLPARLRELVLLQIGCLTGSAYEFSHHIVIAAAHGVDGEDIRAVIAETEGNETDLSLVERASLSAARRLTTELDVEDVTWAQPKAISGDSN